MTSQVLVRCDGARAPRGLAGPDWTSLDIGSDASKGGYNIRIPALDAKLAGNIPDVAFDLVRIGAFVYWADQEVSRRTDVDVYGQLWNRRFAVALPVLDLAVWTQPEVRQALERAVGYGTDDRWEFYFSQAPPTVRRFLFEAGSGRLLSPDSVLLFSGGTDSFCAAAAEASNGRRPILVSHSPSTRAKAHQRALRSALDGGGLGWDFPLVHTEVTKIGNPERERTQRSRGLLYSAVGAAVAASLGIEDVVLADNGYVSVGLPLSGQTVGAKMSRTTHPRFQYLFNTLLDLVLPGTKIRNPLLFNIRAEALVSVDQLGLGSSLKETRSCAAGSRLAEDAPHCGTCSQCIDRRIGFLAAGLSSHDTQYVTDIFGGELNETQVVLAESYLRLMRSLRSVGPAGLMQKYVELSDCATTDAAASPAALQRLAEMVCRQADAFTQVLEGEASRRAPTLVAGRYPRNSLLALALAPTSPRPRLRLAGAPSTPVVVLSEAEERESSRAGFIANVPFVITGQMVSRASNRVEIGGLPVNLRDAEMTLLLRLVVELFTSVEGWCPKSMIVSEGCSPPDIDNAVLRLRRSLGPGLGAIDPNEFIQSSRGKLRVSTHRKYIEVRTNEFETHPNYEIRRLISLIPFA